MSTPAVSVIVPTYNRAHLLGQTVHSVLNQTYADFELVIVDDGSEDDTASMVSRISDSRIKFFQKGNGGISSARNLGIRRSEGRYLAFLDSDDIWLPELLAQEVPVLDNSPAYGAVYARSQYMSEHGRLLPQIDGSRERFPGDPMASMLYGYFVSTPTVLVRRECFDRVGCFDENLVGREDYDMFLRIARHYRYCFIDRILARIRIHGERISCLDSREYIPVVSGRLKLIEKAYADIQTPALLALRPVAFRNAYIDLGLSLLRIRQFGGTLEHFARAVRVSNAPVGTIFRILFQLSLYFGLSKTRWGMNLVARLVRLRARLEGRKHGDQIACRLDEPDNRSGRGGLGIGAR
nr:glycosyltransferase [uncultured Sphaerochaeta sp.]